MVGGSGGAGFGEGAAAPPPRPDLTPGVGTPPARRRRRWPWVVAALVVVNAAVVTIVLTRSDGGGMPDEIAGLTRIRNGIASSFERELSSYRAGGLSLRGAMYGAGDQPQLIVERFVGSDDPFQGLPIDLVLGQAATGFGIGAGGGELDEGATVTDTRGDTRYACAPFRGPPSQIISSGVICVFSGRVTGILFDLRTTVPIDAVDDAEAARDAILGAG